MQSTREQYLITYLLPVFSFAEIHSLVHGSLQVTDVADALILNRLFRHLFSNGAVSIFPSLLVVKFQVWRSNRKLISVFFGFLGTTADSCFYFKSCSG